MKTKEIPVTNYIYAVEHKSADGWAWIRRNGLTVEWSNSDGESVYSVAGKVATRHMSVTERGVRVIFLGLRKPGVSTEPVLLPGASFTLTIERN